MRTLGPAVVAAFAILFSTTGAFADTGGLHEDDVEEDLQEQEEEGASPQDIQRAQEFFDKGAQLYYEGEYSRAAVEFRRAHEIHPHPVFMHNVAIMNKRLDRLVEARNAAREVYELDEQLPPDQDARNRGIIAGADVALLSDELTETIAESRDHDDLDEPPAVADDSGLGAVGVVGIGSLGLGVAGLIGGSVVHYRLQDTREEYEQRRRRNPGSAAVAELGDDVSSQETQRVVLFTAGGTLAALGTTLIIIGARSGASDSDVAISVPLDRPGISASFRW